MTNAVIFDYNGVIADDERIHREAFATVLGAIGLHLDNELYDEHFLGRTDYDGLASLRTAFVKAFEQSSITELVSKKRQVYTSLLRSKDVLYPKAEKVIRRLARYFRLAIVTSSSRDELLAVLARGDLVWNCSCLTTADDVKRGKPDPEGYLKSLHCLKVTPSDALAIEDSPSGVQAAKSAGLRCIAVLHTTIETKLQMADLIVPTIGDIDQRVVLEILGTTAASPTAQTTR